MTKKLLNLAKVALLIFSISFLLGSCTEEKIIEPEGEFAYVALINGITINANQWRWDVPTGRYVASFPFPELNKEDYDVGMAVGNIFITEGGKESTYPLPYIRSYVENNEPFTETISCALSYDKKNIEFYIEPSDKSQDSAVKANYEFKVALIYNFVY